MCSPCAVSRLWVALRLRNSKNACITNIYCDWNSRLDMHDLMSKILDCNPACTHLPCRNLPAGRVNNISWSWTIWLKKITSAFIAAIVLLSQLISPGIFWLSAVAHLSSGYLTPILARTETSIFLIQPQGFGSSWFLFVWSITGSQFSLAFKSCNNNRRCGIR